MERFNIPIEKKVAFVPGHPFYIGKNETNTLRFNFSNVDEATIEKGIKRLGGEGHLTKYFQGTSTNKIRWKSHGFDGIYYLLANPQLIDLQN